MTFTHILPSGLKKKTIMPVAFILILSMTCVAAFNYYSQVSILKTDAEDSVASALSTAQGFIESHLNIYKQMATLLANTPDVGEAIGKGDRAKLTSEYQQSYEALKKGFHLNQMNFHQPPGVALLRLQNVDHYGDNLRDVRKTIADVYKNKTGVKGLEFGRTGLGLRGVEPVFSKGNLVGSLEFGGDLAPALHDTKRANNVECGILIAKSATSVAQSLPDWQGKAKPIGDYLALYSTDSTLTMAIINATMIDKAKAQGSFPYIDTASYQGKSYSLGIAPLKDYSGGIIGYIYVMKDRTVVLSKIYKSLAINVIVFILVLTAIVYAISRSINKTVIEPVVRLSSATNDISKGKVGEKIEIPTGDEIETLAKSIDRLRVSMKLFLG
ncbi:MAG: HAMP domain-containing protein [Desulforhopalus sp.]|nr:HAMP domain-containing protein [Desulforhopalus sp.]